MDKHSIYLIENGADLAAVNNEGDLPIDLADGNDMEDLISDEMDAKDIDADAARNEEEQVILRDANQWLNGTYAETPHPKTGATSLHVAAAKGYMNVMNILIQAGADIDAKDFDGWTPLHAAAHWGQKEACKLLVQNFCNMEVKNQVGQTAIDIADSDTEPLLKELKKEQASLKKDRDENSLQNDNATRNVPPLKRRSSVTRMSVKQKDKVVQETAKDERESLRQAHQMVEEKDEDRSGSKSSEEEAASSGIESSSEESESANSPSIDTEKQNEINRQSSLKSIPQVNGEVKDKNGESESIDTKSSLSISDPPVTPPPKAEVVPPTSPPPKADSPVPPSPVDSPKSPLAPIKEKKTSHEDEEEVKKEDILRKKDTTKETEDSDDIFSRRTKSEIETSLTYDRPRGHSSLNRAASIPAGLLRPQVSTKLPLTKSESLDTAPSSWRAGLRKTGSSSTVSEVTVTDPEKIPRSASSSWLASSDQKHDTEPRLKIHSTSQDGKSRFNDLYSRYSSLVTAAPPTASTTTGSSKRTSAPATSSATTTSSAYTYTPYVPLSRRRPISDISDIGEKSRDLSLLAKGGVPDRQIATVGGCTSPGATGQRRSFEPPKRDEEKEVERKAKAKRARESRRSTQARISPHHGVTKEDLEKAEQALNAADNGQTRTGQVHSLDAHRGSATDDRSNKENSQPDQDSVSSVSRSSSSSSTCSTAKARGTSSIEDKKEAEDSTSHVSSYRRPRDILTDNSSSLSAAPTLSTVGSTATTTVISSSTPSTTPFKTPLYRSKYLSSRPPLEADEDSHDESRNAEKEDPSQKSAAIRARRKRDSRRPTGKVTLEDLPPTDESRKTREDVRKEDDKVL
ncbi:hypothetical protein CAPTEDRAFT_184913 [Capitella teleta]|uniref:Uncharacterized protein n=1 Tax=Capitella teleta TaxID=283909 RepID=X1ZH82_CAPTE|nr:hypothetical protein CAPTEDRAFT_184913 [Capitella teleta]|eukprot:ELT90127.1 hypothetical protein CAPTEDRAFT_184913 [Capitella teleta]